MPKVTSLIKRGFKHRQSGLSLQRLQAHRSEEAPEGSPWGSENRETG